MGKLIEVPAGKNIGQAMKEILQGEAMDSQRKKAMEQQRVVTGSKVSNVMSALLTEFCFDPDHAIEVALGYSCALALATDTPKERFLEGLEKIWTSQSEAHDRQVKAQTAQLMAIARSAMMSKKPIPPPVVQQLQILKVELDEDMKAYLEQGTNGAAHESEVPVDEAKAAAEQPN